MMLCVYMYFLALEFPSCECVLCFQYNVVLPTTLLQLANSTLQDFLRVQFVDCCFTLWHTSLLLCSIQTFADGRM